MSSFNKIILLGRLTRDCETRSFSNGGKVAKFSLAVDAERKKNQAGKWESIPAFLDCEAFNRGEFGKLADTVEQYTSKGSQVLIDGHIKQENWTAADGAKRSKLVVVVDSLQLMGKPKESESQPSLYSRKVKESESYDKEPTFATDNGEPIPF